jgi:ubiquinone biosynthesis protein
VKFPKVYWDQTTERVLTMERVDGLKISLVEQLVAQGIDTTQVARNLAEAVLRQILEFGFFHGDPHPGNLLVVGHDVVCFIDCGMVGRLEEQMREYLILLVSAGIRKETGGITDILLEMNALPADLDRAAFLREANQVLDRYYRLPLKRIRIASIIEDLTGLIHRFRVRIPSELLLVGKALITLEGVGRTLDPDFDVVEVAEPFVRDIVATIYGPKYLSRRIMESSQDFLRLLRDLPSDLRELSRHLRENRLGFVLQHQGLSEAFRQLDRASRRVSVGMVISALVIGSSVLAVSSLEPRFLGIPVPALVGFGVATALAGWVFGKLFRDE